MRIYDKAYAQFRKSVRKRDKNRCRMPNCGSKYRLQVHHIRKWATNWALRYDVKNGITLCSKCHRSISGKEHHYELLFLRIINEDNS